MGSCTFELVFSNLLPFFIACPNQLFRNSFNFYRYNLFLCLLEPVIECRVWNVVANAESVDGNSLGLTLGFVEEPQSFKIFFAKHNLSSFKFSTKVWERNMLVNTPILDGYAIYGSMAINKIIASFKCLCSFIVSCVIVSECFFLSDQCLGYFTDVHRILF